MSAGQVLINFFKIVNDNSSLKIVTSGFKDDNKPNLIISGKFQVNENTRYHHGLTSLVYDDKFITMVVMDILHVTYTTEDLFGDGIGNDPKYVNMNYDRLKGMSEKVRCVVTSKRLTTDIPIKLYIQLTALLKQYLKELKLYVG